MKKIINIIVIISLISMLFSFILPSITYAKVAEVNVNKYKPKAASSDDTQVLNEKAGPIIGVIRIVGIIVSVGALIALGIKYMLGSIEQKAEYKKTFIPYLIGAFLVFSLSLIPQLIYDIMKGFK